MIYRFQTKQDIERYKYDLFVRPVVEHQLRKDFEQLIIEIESWNFYIDAVNAWENEGGRCL